MPSTNEPIIQPVYDDSVDLTGTWGDRTCEGIFPAVYRRYRAPIDAEECKQMIEDLGNIVQAINDQYDSARSQAIAIGLHPGRDRPTKDKLKTIRTARNRNEAIRRAYIHWLSVEGGQPLELPTLRATQFSIKARIDTLAAALAKVVDLYIADLSSADDETAILKELKLLRQQLDAVFVSTDS